MSEKVMDQANTRTSILGRDQHGREYDMVLELKTMSPTGPISPMFEAPIIPPQKYLRHNRREPTRVYIDYDGWEAEVRQRHAEYQEDRRVTAVKMFGQQAHRALQDNPEELRMVVGDPPPPVERILAAKSGNRWALGFTDARPEWADQYFPLPAPETSVDELAQLFPDVDGEGPTFGEPDPEEIAALQEQFPEAEMETAGSKRRR